MENIKVFARIRPQNVSQKSTIAPIDINVASKKELIVQTNPNNASEQKFEFDEIFTETAKQCDVYNAISAPILQNVIRGYNCTLYAYGANGTGTHYTMVGKQNDIATAMNSIPSVSPKTPSMNDTCELGLIPRTLISLFDHLKHSAVNHTVRCSYLGIFNDELIDLLQVSNINCSTMTAGGSLKIYENSKNQVFVNGLTETMVKTPTEALTTFRTGQEHLNSHIQHSHTIFTLNIQLKEKPKNANDDDELIKFSKLIFVQLASGASKGHTKIVQSLASFNRVVQALIDRQNHIPYRDSKLTRITQDSLGGNTKTAIIATIAPESNAIEDTIQTLELMSRIKCIQNTPIVNERTNKNVMLNDVAIEISQLKRDIEANKNKEGVFMTDHDYESQKTQLDLSRCELRRRRFELQTLSDEYDSLESVYADADTNLNVLSRKIALLKQMKELRDRELKQIAEINQQREEYIDKHIVTEKALTEQSKQLANVMENVSIDSPKLHECIERRSMADASLQRASDDFISQMNTLCNNMSEYVDNNGRVFVTIATVHRNNQEKFHLLTMSMLKLFRTNVSLLEKKTDVICDDEQKKLATLFEATLNQCNALALSDEQFALRNKTPFERFVSILEQQFAAQDKAIQTLNLMLMNRADMVIQFATDIGNRMKSFYEEMLGRIRAQRLSLEEAYATGQQLTNKMQTIYDKLRTMMCTVQESDSQMKNVLIPSLEKTRSTMAFSTKELIKTTQSHAEVLNSQKLNFEREDAANDAKTAIAAILKMVQANAAQNDISREALSINGAGESKAVNDRFDMVGADILKNRSSFGSNPTTQKILSDFEGEESRVSALDKGNNNLIGIVAKAEEKFTKETEGKIAACVKEVQFFSEINFCQYPSGETPIKRNFKTDVSLVATTPHDQLKRKFRERFAQADSENVNGDSSFLK